MFCVSSSEGAREVPYLPEELLLNCFSPNIEIVLRKTVLSLQEIPLSLLTSKELYKTRTLLGTTESCLHVILFSSLWFTLCRRPTRPILSCFCRTWKNLLVSVPTHNLSSRPIRCARPAAVGSDIYMIGGCIKRELFVHCFNYEISTRVFVLDCLSYTWHEAPSMHVPRIIPLMTVIDETIYVVEGSKYNHSEYVIECFDTKTKIWETLPIPGAAMRIYQSLAIKGNLYLVGEKKNVVYKPKEKKWDAVGPEVHSPADTLSTCVVDNVSFWYSGKRQLEWWDSKARSWRALKGCERLRNLKGKIRIVNYGRKIAVFWEQSVFGNLKKKIWFAEVTLEKRNNGQEICGEVSALMLFLQAQCFLSIILVFLLFDELSS
ncbi:hypothetical protein AALP_AA6G027200 [Arabis alpina]|uniref:FKB95-like N-terminal Kelch domain-containing protein n=1 Tax=Arabis alpina TaxID=50452 RepID=A0A087GLP5_ARAAL|nr:hypothetical protein AALP_AA6G027200 [Arabis alpina]